MNVNNITLLHIAAYYNATECLIYLLELQNSKKNVFTADAKSAHEFTPLHFACYSAAEECVAILLSYGADASAKVTQDRVFF